MIFKIYPWALSDEQRSGVVPMLLCDDDQTARGEQQVGLRLTKLLLPLP
jgi:hypothetical protein